MLNAVTTFLDRHVEAGNASRPALVAPRGTLGYGELHALSCRVAAKLKELDVQPEQRVALLLHDSPALVAAFFGAIRAGAVAVPLSTRLGPESLMAILEDSRARVLVSERALLEPLGARLAAARSLRAVIRCGPAGDLSDADSPLPATDAFEPEPMCEDDMAFWLYTSGTTGLPKAAVHLHRDMLAWRPYGCEVLGVTEADRAYATSRLFFAYALGCSLLVPLAAGASVCLRPEWPDPQSVAQVMASARPTLFFSVPTMYARLLNAGLPPETFRPARLAVSSGERLPAALCQGFRERYGLEILDAMGATETLFMVFSNRPGASRAGSSGVPVPGTEVRLLDGQGREVGVGEEGVLHVRAPSVSPFYWKRVDRSRSAFVGEWFRTGDVYRRDAEGFYYHCGREDDLFKVAGMWVAPADVEAALLAHPQVLDAGVVGMEEPGGLIKGFAFVVPRPNAPPAEALLADLKRHADETLPPHQRPRAIRLVSELPRTATGKLQRYRLKEQVRQSA